MKIKINGLEFEIEDPNLSKALEQERADSEKILKEAESAKTQAEARADAAEGKVKTLETELKTFRADQAKKERAELVEAARSLSKDLKIDKETPDEIRRMALESKGIKLDGKSDEYVRFRFEHELETNTPVDKVREVLHEDDNDSAEIFSIDRAVKGW